MTSYEIQYWDKVGVTWRTVAQPSKRGLEAAWAWHTVAHPGLEWQVRRVVSKVIRQQKADPRWKGRRQNEE